MLGRAQHNAEGNIRHIHGETGGQRTGDGSITAYRRAGALAGRDVARRGTLSPMPSPIRDNTALSRFELDAGGVTAFMTYRLAGNVMTLAHTETPVAARGRGIASQLVKGVLNEMRRRGLKIVPRCPFVSAYLAKHAEYRDLVA